jgi:hypothetical protein
MTQRTGTDRGGDREDVPVILELIRSLADYERLAHEVVGDPDSVRDSLFGARTRPEAVDRVSRSRAGRFAVWFQNYSTFLVGPALSRGSLRQTGAARSRVSERKLLAHVRGVAVPEGRRDGMVGLDWNEPAIGFYRAIGAVPMDGWTVYRLTGDALQQLRSQAVKRAKDGLNHEGHEEHEGKSQSN